MITRLPFTLSSVLGTALLILAGCASPESTDPTTESEAGVNESQIQTAAWSYSGDTGPAQWASLDSAFAACDASQQSPIDLPTGGDATSGPLTLSYSEAEGQLIDTGHAVQVDHNGGTLTVNGTTYNLVQFHFHTPSEHTVDGTAYPAEVHLVHAADDGTLAVIGSFIEEGAANEALGPFWDDLESLPDAPIESFDASALLPENRTYYTYDGSLTTPPCSEVVTWIVMQSPITMSADQLDALRNVHDDNARPVQPIGDRSVAVRTP